MPGVSYNNLFVSWRFVPGVLKGVRVKYLELGLGLVLMLGLGVSVTEFRVKARVRVKFSLFRARVIPRIRNAWV